MSDDLKTSLGDAWPTPPVPAWTPDDTERFLTQFALPTDFRWDRTEKRDGEKVIIPDQPVLPNYSISKGYGFWLRTTPYFPGLFEEIHGILARWPDDEELPSAEHLAAVLDELRRARGEQTSIPLYP